MKKLLLTAVAVIASVSTAACSASSSGIVGEKGELSLAPQFGMAYLPHIVMMEKGLLKESLPNVKVKEVKLSGGGSVVEQMIAGAVNVGYMGTAPFLKAIDSGADIRALSCLEEMPLNLMTTEDSIKSLKDLKPSARIALPAHTSSQAATLRVAAFQQWGDPSKLEKQMVSLPHPDSMAALLSGQEVSAHFAQPPFVGQEERKGAHSILSSFDVFGPHCLIVAVATADFVERNPSVVKGLQDALSSAVEEINNDPDAAVQALTKSGEDTDPKYLLQDVTDKDITWTTEITNVQKVADALHEAKVLSQDLDVSKYVAEGANAS